MRYSRAFLHTERQAMHSSNDVTTLMKRAGLIEQIGSLERVNQFEIIIPSPGNGGSGDAQQRSAQAVADPSRSDLAADIYVITPYGERVVRRIEHIVREELVRTEALECSLPVLQPAEYATRFVRSSMRSGKQLPVTLFQMGPVFHEGAHPRHGVSNARQLLMANAYSFDRDTAGLHERYHHMRSVMERILHRLHVQYEVVLSENRERDAIHTEMLVVQEEGSPVEIGHLMQLGDQYSEAFDVHVDGVPVQMGAYAFGITRAMYAIVEQHQDEDGIVWPRAVAPYQGMLIDLTGNGDELYREFDERQIPILYDDRPERAGVKFHDAKLLGLRMIIRGKHTPDGCVEVEERSGDREIMAISRALRELAWR